MVHFPETCLNLEDIFDGEAAKRVCVGVSVGERKGEGGGGGLPMGMRPRG